jgi:PAS domain S-box-containing protein
MMAKRPKKAVSEYQKVVSMPLGSIKKKKIPTRLSDRRTTRSLKNSSIAKPFLTEKTANVSAQETRTLKKQMEFILGVTRTGLDIIDSDFNIRYVDPEWAKLYGDPTGNKCYKYFMERDEVCPGCGVKIALETKRVTVTEEILIKEGNRPIQVTTIPFQNERGEWLVAEVNADISERKRIEEALHKAHEEMEKRVQERTAELARANEAMQGEIIERKRAEETLRQSEERYRTVLEDIQEGYFEVDLAGNYTFVNDVLCKRYGYTREELIGKNYRQYTHEEDQKKVFQAFNEAYRTGRPVRVFDDNIIRKDGAIGTYEISASLVRDSKGKAIGFRGTSRDITERKQAEELLRESEAKFQQLFDEAPVGYHEYDTQGRITKVNRTELEMLGYTHEEVLGQPVWKFIGDEETSRDLVLAKIAGTVPPGHSFERAYHRKDGTTLTVLIEDRPLTDSEGKIVGIRSTIQDVTERKKAEEALRRSEEKYRTILESIEDGYYEEDLAGNFVFFNEAMCRIYGYPKEELLGLNYKQYTDENTAKQLFQLFSEIYKTGNPCSEYSYELIRKDGAKRYIEASASLKRDPSGKPIGFRGVVRDITERERAEEALRQSEEKYRNILQSIQDGYFENDLAGNLTFINDIVCTHLGYTREELIGMNYRQYTDEENARKLYQRYNQLYVTGQIKPFEIEFTRKDGSKLTDELSISLIKDSEGKTIAFRCTARDISERKQAEEDKLSLQEQLRQSQKMEAIGQLAGGVAHDFNNLLTVIKGYSQLSLLDLKENDPLRGNIQEIEKATQRATDLTRQLLAFSRRQILDLKVVDLNLLLKDTEKMLRRIIGEDIELVTHLSEDLGKVKIDPSQIEQVIFNLVVNARDAMPSGGKLTIETANVELDEAYAHTHVGVVPGRYVRLSVSDTGVGMTHEVKEKVFEPFFTTKEKGKGTGLGLSMVYGIVKQSNGNIWVYSEPNRGTTFRIYFPRSEEEADTRREREETDFFPRGSETILLVEDDELVRDLASRLLKQQGYTVLEASNGQEALSVAKEHVGETIHLLLADIVMPQMGGKELADWLKISRPNVKVLFTSGYADYAIVHHGVLDAGTQFLQKPFSLKTLSHKVREVLDG